MFARIFRRSDLSSFLIGFLIVLAMRLPMEWISPVDLTIDANAFATLIIQFTSGSRILSMLFGISSLVITALIWNYWVNSNKITQSNNSAVFFSFLLLMVLAPDLIYFQPAHLSLLLISFVPGLLFELSLINDGRSNLFILGLILSISFISFPPSTLWLLAVLFGIVWFKTLNFREFVVFLWGVFFPLFTLYTAYFALEKESLNPFDISNYGTIAFHGARAFLSNAYEFYLILALMLLSIPIYFSILRSNTVRVRKMLNLLFFIALTFILAPTIITFTNKTYVHMLALPLSLMLSFSIISPKKLWKSNLFLGFFIVTALFLLYT